MTNGSSKDHGADAKQTASPKDKPAADGSKKSVKK